MESLYRVLDSLPWKPRDPAVKGEPRRTVKWIDVSAPIFWRYRVLLASVAP